jgi:hypothetical protein
MTVQGKRPLLLLVVAIASGCSTMGSGTGSTATGGSPTVFSWKGSSDGSTGTMTATMNGQNYSGQFFQITDDTTADTVGPLWTGWGAGFGRFGGGWDYWGADAFPDFITHYSGRVLANLSASNGTHMRCKFQLAHPDSGMSGGGSGKCQLPDGKSIVAEFPVS